MSWTAGKYRWSESILLLGVLFACLFSLPNSLKAQGMMPTSGYAPHQGGMMPMYAGPGQGYPYATGAIPGMGYRGSNNMVTTQAPYDTEEIEPLPIETFIRTAVKNAWFTTEYMSWSLERPGTTMLGSPLQNHADPREQFDFSGGTARAMDLDAVDLEDNNGIRMTLGIPLRVGTLESTFFLLEQASDNAIAHDVPAPGGGVGTGNFIITPVTVDGQVSSFFRAYDESFRANYDSDVWSGEMNIVLDPFNAARTGEGFKITPLVGIRFLNVHEKLIQTGSFRTTPSNLTSVIESDVHNNMYGINLGLRTELVHRWFTVGFSPKVALGFNSYRAQVMSDRFVSASDPLLVTKTKETDFAAIMDFSLYGSVNVSENFRLFGSYGLIWLSRLARPGDTIDYNVNGILGTPVSSDIKAKESETNMWMQGFTVGGEIIFR